MKVGVHPRVSELIQDVFNNWPPQPEYTFIWEVQRVLDFIKENWRNNKEIIDKELSWWISAEVKQLAHWRKKWQGTFLMNICWGQTVGTLERKSDKKLSWWISTEVKQLANWWEKVTRNFLDEYLLRSKSWHTREKKQLLLTFTLRTMELRVRPF